MKKVLTVLILVLGLHQVQAQFSVDLGYTISHFYGLDKPLLIDKPGVESGTFSGSFSLRYKKEKFHVFIGTIRYNHAWRSKGTMSDDVYNHQTINYSTWLMGANYYLIDQAKLKLSSGINLLFKQQLKLKDYIFSPPESHDHTIYIDSDLKVGANLELEYALCEWAVFRLKSLFVLPSRIEGPYIENHSSYMLYQISYGIYL